MSDERKIKHVVQVYQTPLYKETINTALRFGLERKQYAQMLLDNCKEDRKFNNRLGEAFLWRTTPEGHRFWEGVWHGIVPDEI